MLALVGRTKLPGLAAALCLLLVVASTACSGDDDDGSNDDGNDSAESADAGDETTTTTDAPSTTTTTSPFYGGPEYSNDGPTGAGCTPGDVAPLPEGWWAGEIKAVDGTSVELDLVCWLGGDAGIAAAAEDGQPFDAGFYIRNADPRTFTETFASGDIPATCAGNGAGVLQFACTVADVLSLYPGPGRTTDVDGREAVGHPIVWLHVTGTTPDYIYVVFTP